MDKVGRRYPVSIGYSIMNLTLWLMGILFYVGSEKAHSALVSDYTAGRLTISCF